MTQTYEISIYDINGPNGAILTQILQKDVIDDLSFSGVKNNGLGDITIQINEPLTTTRIQQGQIVKINYYDDFNKSGLMLYTGFIDDLNRIRIHKKDDREDVIELSLLHIKNILNRIVYKEGTNATFRKTATNVEHIEAILSYFDTFYPGLITIDQIFPYVGDGIEAEDLEIEFDKTDCFDALRKINEVTGQIFFIDASGVFRSVPGGSFSEQDLCFLHTEDGLLLTTEDDLLIEVEECDLFKKLKDGVEIRSITKQGELFPIVNYLEVEREEPALPFPIPQLDTFQNLDSISQYGRFENRINREDLGSGSVEALGTTFINQNSTPKNYVTIETNNVINFFDIKPGDVLTIENTEIDYGSLQVNKISYTIDGARIECGDFETPILLTNN